MMAIGVRRVGSDCMEGKPSVGAVAGRRNLLDQGERPLLVVSDVLLFPHCRVD